MNGFVIGWAMSERMTTPLICDALQMALWQRKHPKGVIVHSDRGSQYCSHDYQALLKKHKLICSMSAKGNCYDNACAETFFHSLKGLCCTNGKGLRVSVKCCDDDLYPSEISHHELANLQCSFEISGLTDALDRQRDVLAW